jgi:hypothetical protein
MSDNDRVLGSQGSPALDKPLRTRERAALDILIAELEWFADRQDDTNQGRIRARNALRRAAELLK